MEPTLLYNGVHLQRKKRFTLSPRHSFNSTVEINWPQSLTHEQTSPTQKIKRRQKAQIAYVGQRHNSFVSSYLASSLNLTDSRTIRLNSKQDKSVGLKESGRHPQGSSPESGFCLPKIYREESNTKRNSIASELIRDRNNSYWSRILKQKLQKYDFEDEA